MWEAARRQRAQHPRQDGCFGLVVLVFQAGVDPCLLRTIHNFMKAPQIILLFMEYH